MSDDHKYPSDTADRFQIRMPSGLRERIARAAEASGRSMNAEIIGALRKAFPAGPSISAIHNRLRRIRTYLNEQQSLDDYRLELGDTLDDLYSIIYSALKEESVIKKVPPKGDSE